MSAQIIPFPDKRPSNPSLAPRDWRTAEFTRLIAESIRMTVYGIERPDWDAYVGACLDKVYSESD